MLRKKNSTYILDLFPPTLPVNAGLLKSLSYVVRGDSKITRGCGGIFSHLRAPTLLSPFCISCLRGSLPLQDEKTPFLLSFRLILSFLSLKIREG